MMQAFEQPFHGIRFVIPDESYCETQDGVPGADVMFPKDSR